MTFDPNSVDFPKLDTPFVQPDMIEPGKGRIISIPWYRLLIALWNRTGGTTGNTSTANQPGFVIALAAGAVPEGYLACDGASYLTTQFPNLFGQIGYTFGGAGDTFKVPDYRNKFLLGDGSVAAGTFGGSSSVTILTANMPAHNHPVTITDPGHTHPNNVRAAGTAGNIIFAGYVSGTITGSIDTGSNTTGITATTTNTGNGDPLTLPAPPNVAVKWVIKT